MVSTLQEAQKLFSTMPSLDSLQMKEFSPLLDLLIQGSLDKQPLLLTIGDVLSNSTDIKVRRMLCLTVF